MEGVLQRDRVPWDRVEEKKRSKGNVKHVCFSAFIGQVDRGLQSLKMTSICRTEMGSKPLLSLHKLLQVVLKSVSDTSNFESFKP